MSSVPTLEDLPPLAGKRVLLRVDFNVPLRDGEITIRPGRIKGWGMHHLQHDRYWVAGGRPISVKLLRQSA